LCCMTETQLYLATYTQLYFIMEFLTGKLKKK
jgi:hypothetical protein